MYCLYNDLKYLHLKPYHDNPNWETEDTLHTYYYNDKPFLTHLKGGFSENKMSSEIFEFEFEKYLEELENQNEHTLWVERYRPKTLDTYIET